MACRRIFFCVFILTILSFEVLAQDYDRIAGIKQQLSISTDGIEQFQLLGDLAFEYRFAHPDSTIYFSQQAYNLGLKLKLKLGMARPFNFMGVAHNYKGDRLAAYEAYSKAFEIAVEQNDTLQIAHAKNNMGRVFFDQGLLSRSYDYFLEAIPLFEEVKDSTGMAYGYQSLANLYRTQRDYVKAEEFFVKALEIRLKLKRTRDIMSAYTYLGRLYNESGKYTKATEYFLKADSGYSSTNDQINLAETRIFLAENYIEDNKVKEAEEIFERGYEVISRSNVVRFQPRAHITLGKIDFLKGDYRNAKSEFEKGLSVAKDIKDIALQMEAHLYLSKVAEKQANPSDQLNNYNKYLILKDSLKDLDVARQVERLQFELQIEKKDQENKLLKINEERNNAIITQQRYQNIALFAVVFSLLIVGSLIWRNSRRKAAANNVLAKQNAEIESQRVEILKQNEELANQNLKLSELNHEKDTLMSIVAHDLKSPLNRIRGLVEVIRLEPGGLSEDKLKLLKMIETSTQAGVDLITDLLDVHEIEENRNVLKATIDMPSFLRSRLENFRSIAIAKGIDIKLEDNHVGAIQSDIEYLNRILDNLLSNAIKFSPKGSVIEMSSGRDGDMAWISVKDHGPGFQDFDKTLIYQKFKRLSARPTGGESSNGLGLAIVKTLVDRLQGEIILNTTSGKGSEFIVKFPAN
ncbi:ATP-binding protein [Chryseotalea sanaruensis]|uniref:ATP-binding protein n=1 Tax=Chryseotalea sanaruensis TaxID=2482724 RepID=UPI000F8E643A|nr:tetratricopeptide repeat-containing sensor histidine kinase [Chryseotalea sanaruensis]